VIPVANVSFVEAGTYTMCFFIGGGQIGSRVLEVTKLESPKQEDRQSPSAGP
jgi:hypothetical protein